MAKILDGKIVRDIIARKLARGISRLKNKPQLAIIQVGNCHQSSAYIRQKKLFGQRIGVLVLHKQYPEKVAEKKLIAEILKLNKNKTVHGIIVQLPLPSRIDKERILEAIDPRKDIDGMTAKNLKSLWIGNGSGLIPATTKGILALLDYYKISVSGKKVVVVGRSLLVGKPTAMALSNQNATVTICHSRTKNLEDVTKDANILIVAAGKVNLITKKHISAGQVIIDVGINMLSDKKLTGDVDFENVKKIVGVITPVPGGVGPMTVASLFENLLLAYRAQKLRK